MAITFAALKKKLLQERKDASSESMPSKPELASGAANASLPSADELALQTWALSAERLSGCIVGTIPTVRYVPDAIDTSAADGLIRCIYSAQCTSKWVGLKARRLQQWGGTPTPNGLVDLEPLPAWLEAVIEGLVGAGIFDAVQVRVQWQHVAIATVIEMRIGAYRAVRWSGPSCPETHVDDASCNACLQRPNHVLINEYLSGQGILPHTDGPSYLPCVATLSLGSDCIMRYQPRGASTAVVAEVVLRDRSLVVTTEAAYTDYMHSINPCDEEIVGATGAPCINAEAADAKEGEVIERKKRVSLTIRHVPSLRQPGDASLR